MLVTPAKPCAARALLEVVSFGLVLLNDDPLLEPLTRRIRRSGSLRPVGIIRDRRSAGSAFQRIASPMSTLLHSGM